MHPTRKLTVRHKLTLMTALASMIAVLLAAAAAVSYELVRFHQELEGDLCAQAEVLRMACAAAVAAGDQKATAQVLFALRGQPEIIFARVYAGGRFFATYERPDAPPAPVSLPLQTEGHGFDRGQAFVYRPILFGGQSVGTLALRADQHEWRAQLKGRASIMLVVILMSLLVALVLAMRLHRVVARLLLNLTQLAASVSGGKDRAVSAPAGAADEIELLIAAFNQMLAQVREQTEALSASEQRFRQVTESIREVFWLTDVEKNEMVYISPGYEAIWGRTRSSLEASPLEWAEGIHSEDRDRVLNASVSKQASGEYDEEYRITRPDGSVRWIHDRAFPVRDEAGRVYRIAGIAEDITERKQLQKQLLEISDREQGRIGRDLHDGLCQLLTAIGYTGTALKQDLKGQSLPEAAVAERIVHRLNDAIAMSRELARGLYPVGLQSEGLAAALLELAANTRHMFSVSCSAECAEAAIVRDQAVATHLYRIAQEAVYNAVKHARPSHISISLTVPNGKMVLAVADDGVGIPAAVRPGNGMGLAIMRYRAGMIGGTLEIRRADTTAATPGHNTARPAGAEGKPATTPSAPARGTIVSCSFPTEPPQGGFSI